MIKEIGTDTNRLFKAASETIMNSATIFLGLTVGATMTASTFLNQETLMIVGGGFLAFAISICGGIFAVKIYNLFSSKKNQSIKFLDLKCNQIIGYFLF